MGFYNRGSDQSSKAFSYARKIICPPRKQLSKRLYWYFKTCCFVGMPVSVADFCFLETLFDLNQKLHSVPGHFEV